MSAESSNVFDHETSNGDVKGKATAPKPIQEQANIITVQPLKKAELQPSYKGDLGYDYSSEGGYGKLINGLGAISGFFGQLPCCFCCPNPFQEVKQGSVGIVSRFGRVRSTVDPGLVSVNPCSESLKIVDVKIQVTQIPQQVVMSKDNVNINIESVLVWSVTNPYRAAFGIQNVQSALIETAQTTLRDVVGARALQNVVSDREGVAHAVEEIVESVAEKWGVTVSSILIKDILFSKELQESLSSAATQRRIGESKVIAARAEVDAAKLMRQAADILASPAAMQIRQLEALQSMAKSSGSKTIFVPMSLTQGGSFAGGSTYVQEDGKVAGGQASEMEKLANLNQLANM